jgi:predicted unusual protein kinase regulating ubiquinone biosynthesis (AarF/ABC1/UbiB family)
VLLDFGATRQFSAEFVANYARISRAVVDGDRDAVARGAVHVGYAAAGDTPERIDAAVDICLLICEPLRHVGRYDFGASNLAARVRKLAFELAVRRRLLRSPPPETLFLHRKLVGSFLLLARLGVQVDARSLILPFLPKA